MPNSDSASSVRPAPSRPVRPTISPRRTFERDILDIRRAATGPDLEHDRCRRRSARRTSWSKVLPVISSVRRVCVMPSRREGPDVAPVAQHGDAAADFQHFGQPVADEHDGDPIGRQSPHDLSSASVSGWLSEAVGSSMKTSWRRATSARRSRRSGAARSEECRTGASRSMRRRAASSTPPRPLPSAP